MNPRSKAVRCRPTLIPAKGVEMPLWQWPKKTVQRPKLDFPHLGGVAGDIGQAIEHCLSDFLRVGV